MSARRVFFLPSSSHGFPVIITITVLKLCFTFKVNIFKEAVVCSKEHRMAGFCEFLSTLWSGNWSPAWKSTFTSDTTTDTVFPCVRSEMMSVLMLKEKVKGSFGSRFLVFGVWIPSFWLYGGVLRICRAEETFFSSYEQHLAHARVQRKWLFLATRHLKYRMGGVQKFSFRVHKFIIVHAAVCLSYINGIVEISILLQYICVIFQLWISFRCCHSECICMYCITRQQP